MHSSSIFAVLGSAPSPGVEAALEESESRKPLFWRLQLLGWSGSAGLMIAFSGIEYFEWRDAVLFGCFRSFFGFVVTCWALRPLYRRWRRKPMRLWRWAAGVLFLSSIVGALDASGTTFFMKAVASDSSHPVFSQLLLPSGFLRTILYILWSLLYFGIHARLDHENARLRLARAEAAERSSELQLLRAQVNPHFLFNALNSILAESDNPVAVRSLTMALSECLRFSLRQGGDIQPLGNELEMLENYLRVEKARFEEKLGYRVEADEAARRTLAPIALVQPLLDNAIKYGQCSPIRPVQVSIQAEVTGGELAIAVFNTGGWVNPGTLPSTGTGISNLRRRLHLLYGERASLIFEKAPEEVRAWVRLPISPEGGVA